MDVKIKVICENCGKDMFKETDDIYTFQCIKCKRETEIEIIYDKGYLLIEGGLT